MSAGGFVAGLDGGELRVLVCRACRLHQTLDPFFCARCGGPALDWTPVGGNGRVHAVTEVYRAPSDAYRDLVPYTLVLIDLDAGGRVMGRGAAGLAIGDAVTGAVVRHAELPLLRFARREEPA